MNYLNNLLSVYSYRFGIFKRKKEKKIMVRL